MASDRPTVTCRPLASVTVLDLSRVLAGPFCTQQFIDLGARVIKVEQPGLGDATRTWGPPFTDDGRSAYFLSCNRGKESIAIDLKAVAGRALVERLAGSVDVVVESFRPGQLDQWGLGLARLRERNARLVTCSISAYGGSGPRREEGGYDALMQAMAGLMAITGPKPGPASKFGVAVVDLATGLAAAQGVLAALIARGAERPWTSRHVDVALYDSALTLLANVGAAALLTGREPERVGNEHAAIVPYQVFAARDGDFFLAVGNEMQWRDVARAMSRADWLQNAQWSTNPGRVADRERLIATLAEEFALHARAEIIDRLGAVGVPIGPVRGVLDALQDPVVAARGLITTHADGTRSMTSPVRFHDQPAPPSAPAPGLGDQTRQILESFGLTRDEIDTLVDQGAVVDCATER